ncbi:hypothetical protein L1987_37753 [Smallanthus sonchifolius]|uniref:Uncharacterized protein n=1 Tax=Smallanthus sonchifolius TaxID=185202 RepID=A0ACB9HIG6_9ASTR|nr:hypothetical protein L1987_37753 [Smallanthus sonchifolius]
MVLGRGGIRKAVVSWRCHRWWMRPASTDDDLINMAAVHGPKKKRERLWLRACGEGEAAVSYNCWDLLW